MLNYWNLKPEEHLEFSHSHSNIVRPGGGGSLNPYYVGFRIFGDIRKRWDKAFEAGKNDPEFQASKSVEVFDDKGNIVKSKIDGMAKILKVRNEDDDVSFISNYLTRELAEDMKLFVYGQDGDSEDPDDDDIIIKDRQFDAVKDALVGRLHNNGAPPVRVMRADESGLYLRHDHSDPLTLDKRYTGETLKYIYAAWKRPVFLETRDADGEPVTYQVTSKGVAFKAKSDEGETMVKVRI
jgi:stage V sporulation protein R